MQESFYAGLVVVLLAPAMATAQTKAPPGLGTEEFGLSPRELVQAIENTESLIARCMRDQGFEYVAADYNTVRAGMSADKHLPGLSEEDFVRRHGFGVSTFSTPPPPPSNSRHRPAPAPLAH